MEKRPYDDSYAFLYTALGKGLDFVVKLQLCLNVSITLRDMYSCRKLRPQIFCLMVMMTFRIDIIHGDIKPENVLIFGDTNGRFIAKVTDFGYSTIVTTTDTQFVFMPKSDPWYAPEYYPRGFTFSDAKRMEMFSYGLFCLWFLFYDAEADFLNISLLKERKLVEQLFSFVRQLMANIVVPTESPILDLERFFDSILVYLPEERALDLDELLKVLDPER